LLLVSINIVILLLVILLLALSRFSLFQQTRVRITLILLTPLNNLIQKLNLAIPLLKLILERTYFPGVLTQLLLKLLVEITFDIMQFLLELELDILHAMG
jgi:hypothetical protein